jgi:hypothetical protein
MLERFAEREMMITDMAVHDCFPSFLTWDEALVEDGALRSGWWWLNVEEHAHHNILDIAKPKMHESTTAIRYAGGGDKPLSVLTLTDDRGHQGSSVGE